MRQWPYVAIAACAPIMLVLALLPGDGTAATLRLALAFCTVAIMAGALFQLHAQSHRAALTLEELRGWVNLLAGTPLADIAAGKLGHMPIAAEVQAAILDMLGRQLEQQGAMLRRFEAMLNTLPDGVAVINGEGLISLVNAAGRGLFTDLSPAVGKSAFEILSRGSLQGAVDQAKLAGAPITARLFTIHGVEIDATVIALGEDGGALLRYPASAGVKAGDMEHDLTLHDRPPAPCALTPDLAISRLAMMSLDTETTGLDPKSDRVVSIGGVRMQGGRIYRAIVTNLLVKPGKPIPARTVAVHGISNAMVAAAPRFQGVATEIIAATDGLLLLGHHIGFDVAILSAEFHRIGMKWSPIGTLDVMLIYAALFPERKDLTLDGIAKALDVTIVGRHSALGDALTVAEIFSRLAPILEKRHVRTMGELQALCETSRDVLAKRANDRAQL